MPGGRDDARYEIDRLVHLCNSLKRKLDSVRGHVRRLQDSNVLLSTKVARLEQKLIDMEGSEEELQEEEHSEEDEEPTTSDAEFIDDGEVE